MDERAERAEQFAWGRPYALLLVRLLLGLIFFMAGFWKVFELTPIEHARRMFVGPYVDSFLPAWSLWLTGTVIPVVELAAGGLVILGLWRKAAYLGLAAVLVTVTFGHLLAEPLYQFHTHVIPRSALLLLLLWAPLTTDRFSLDEVRARQLAKHPTA